MANQLLYKHELEELIGYRLDFSDVLPDDTGISVSGVARDSTGELVSTGAVVTASVDASDASTGFSAGDIVTIDGGITPAIVVIDTVDGGGTVLTFTVVDDGTGYAVGTHETTVVTGSGGGLVISVDSVDNADVLSNLGSDGMEATMDIIGGDNGQEYRLEILATGNDTGSTKEKVIELRLRNNIEGAF